MTDHPTAIDPLIEGIIKKMKVRILQLERQASERGFYDRQEYERAAREIRQLMKEIEYERSRAH